MWCNTENNQIKKYSKLPQNFKNFIGFDKMESNIHESEGFYLMQLPVYDADLQQLGELYFDEVFKVFTYIVVNIELPALAEAKAQKITELKDAVKGLYQSIQWYLELCRSEGTPIPATLTNKIKTIRTKYEQAKTQINGYDSVIDVVKWKVPYEQIEAIRVQLDEIG